MKRDKELTVLANFDDPRSFVGQRIHPGTEHHCEYLRGEIDVGLRRMVVFERDKGLCQSCGAYASWDWGEMHHIVGGLGLQRCWCMENLAWSCPPCHDKKHVGPMWRKR